MTDHALALTDVTMRLRYALARRHLYPWRNRKDAREFIHEQARTWKRKVIEMRLLIAIENADAATQAVRLTSGVMSRPRYDEKTVPFVRQRTATR